ncbi:unnamed protein product [Didymodactylos carnosus]|uniref:Laccase n=1 Tax=Didymodactylos carnosus TaxID=1234261 RepID=A0A813TV37_9BILA|nr:unnamed protein product [Didymodactylos carnosus]CAF1232151.1 unnamed protein product [Didymodactylos carnosus]CAF3603997.1 unnamed protein product [Didymodactylos carnosus]CAF4040338.1 unnamed protein product [Didymodactylos carnosus]
MDGVTRITQCPIEPGETFTYKFVASNKDTHWYHAHSGVQRTEGLYGAFIVTESYAAADKNNSDNKSDSNDANRDVKDGYEQEFYFIVQEWLQQDSLSVFNYVNWENTKFFNSFTETTNCFAPNRMDDGTPVAPVPYNLKKKMDAILINGKGWYNLPVALQYVDSWGSNAFNLPLEVFTVKPNKKYLFRVIGANAGHALEITIGGHKMTIVASDGKKCRKVNCPFWPSQNDGPFDCISPGLYKSLSSSIPESDRIDMFKNQYKKEEFEEHFLNFHFSGSTSQRASINGRQFILPSYPPFFEKDFDKAIVPCRNSCIEESTCDCTNKLKIGTNKIIQLIIYNMGKGAGIDGTAHPVHFHGHHFYVVAMGYPTYNYTNHRYKSSNTDINCKNETNSFCNYAGWSNKYWSLGNIASIPIANLVNPPIKDTIFVPVGGFIVARFRSNNIGLWFLHCHIEVHQAEGMALFIQEGSDDEIRSLVKFDEINLCHKGPNIPDKSASLNRASQINDFKPILILLTLLCIIQHFSV